MTKPIKARRRLTDISFENDGAAVALVSKEQGGPANGRDTALIMKSTANFSEDFVEKAQQVRVTMELPEFLQKFFDMWCDDAEMLARMMGYQPPEEDDSPYSDYQDYIDRKLESFEILKSAYESESIAEVISNINEDQYLTMLRDQEIVEKAFSKVDSAKEELAKANDSEQPVVAAKKSARIVEPEDKGHKAVESEEVDKSAESDENAQAAVQAEENTNVEVNKMSKDSVTVEKTEQVEMVEKSALEAVNKALEEQKEALEKALSQVAKYEQERKQAQDEARQSVLKSYVGEENVEAMFKAVGELEEESFQSVVDVLKAVKADAESQDMFEEQGGEGEEVIAKSSLKQMLEAQYKK